MDGAEALIPITMFAGGFAMTFGIFYLRSRENMAMIDKNMNPRQSYARPAPYKNLKWALLFIGAGAGLLLAFFLDKFAIPHQTIQLQNGRSIVEEHDGSISAVYFALIAMGGGLGLFGSYLAEKKWMERQQDLPK